MKKLFLIDYESAHWCGGQMSVVVWAKDADEAVCLADVHMSDAQMELFTDSYADSIGDADEYADDVLYVVNSIEEFGPEHDTWQYFQDPSQSEFFPVIGEPDETNT
jgi:hypothetical protein